MVRFLSALWSLVKPYQVRLALGALMGVLAGLVEPLLMVAVKLVVNTLFPTAGAPAELLKLPAWAPGWAQKWLASLGGGVSGAARHHGAFLLLVACIPGVILLRGLLSYLNVYFLQWASWRAITDLRVRLFVRLLNLPLGFFQKTSTGELMSRLMNDIGTLQNVISGMTAVIIKEPATLVSLLVFLLWQNPRMTLASLVVLPVCVVPITIYSRKVRKAAGNIQTHFAELSQIIHEVFTGVRIIKAYNLEKMVEREFIDKSAKFVGQYMRLIRSVEIPGPLIEFFGAVGVALFLAYIGLFSGAKPSAGDFLATVGSIFLMYRPIKLLTRLQNQLIQARAASERVFELLALKSDLKEPSQPVPLRAAGADIQFDQVSFAYAEKLVLREIQLTVKAGQLVALVGESGSGKTTLTNLLLRFYDPERGTVRIGGVDLRDVSTSDLRNQIAVVTQETVLFNETIRRNIELGRPGASDAEIEAAAKHAHALEFIRDKPQGFDTVIGEKGVALSGGQRQRLAIARAILKDAPILVLDEATSALDSESERAVQAALEELMQGRTTICIAHRLSTIQKADLIVVLDQGRIVEVGRHAELLAHDGVYRRLHELQFRSELPEKS